MSDAPDRDPETDPDEPVGDFGEPHQSDEGGDSDVDASDLSSDE